MRVRSENFLNKSLVFELKGSKYHTKFLNTNSSVNYKFKREEIHFLSLSFVVVFEFSTPPDSSPEFVCRAVYQASKNAQHENSNNTEHPIDSALQNN